MSYDHGKVNSCLIYWATLPSLATACPHTWQTCSVGQSKFKVLTIKLHSLPADLRTFWCHSINTWREAKSATCSGILSFLKIRMNDTKSIREFLSGIDCDLILHVGESRKKSVHLNIVCAISGRRSSFSLWIDYKGRKRPVLNMIFRLKTPNSE